MVYHGLSTRTSMMTFELYIINLLCFDRRRFAYLGPNKEDVALVKSTLTLVDRVTHPIRRILRSAEQARPALRQTLLNLSIRQSFHLIPDEVLSIIFEFAVQDCPSTSTSLSHVSRRFRQISLRLPNLWSTISSHKLLDDAQARFRRSGRSPIDVFICAHQGQRAPQDRAFSLFKFAVSLSTRLQHLELRVQLKTDGPFFVRFLAQFPILSLPSLESLSFACTAVVNDEHIAMLTNWKPFLRWHMPSLREIHMQNFVPSFAPLRPLRNKTLHI